MRVKSGSGGSGSGERRGADRRKHQQQKQQQQQKQHPKRPGASIQTTSARWEEVKRVEELLRDATRNKDEKLASGLRQKICGLLSDLIILNPGKSLAEDAHFRLWRNCFYEPIAGCRTRISKEKSRIRKKTKNKANSNSNGNLSSPELQELEKSMKSCLGDAIKLYQFLIDRYLAKLVDHDKKHGRGNGDGGASYTSAVSQTQGSQSLSLTGSAFGTHATSSEDQSELQDPSDLNGVVPGLYHSFIYLGDLHRYAASHDLAEKFYLKASKLAPGMGNPYNQLAVVAQAKDGNMSCLALYWYVRSLLATHHCFDTSTTNLERLFDMNRKYLANTEDHVASTERLADRNVKAAAIRFCLAQFVEIQYKIFQEHNVLELEACVGVWCDDFQLLLAVSAFGDSLLCKMVAIHAYSVDSSDEKSTYNIAKAFLMPFGNQLAKRLAHGLQRSSTSTRCLSPLLLLCDFWEILHFRGYRGDETKDADGSFAEFFRSLCEVANLLLGANGDDLKEDDDAPTKLREYRLLKGFQPFASLFEYPLDDAFVKAEEALDALDLVSAPSQSQITQSSEHEAKVARFLAFTKRTLLSQGSPIAERRIGGYRLAIDEDEPSMDTHSSQSDEDQVPEEFLNSQQHHNDDKQKTKQIDGSENQAVKTDLIVGTDPGPSKNYSPAANMFDDMDVDDADDRDTVTYKSPEAGGPPLLVPCALTMASSNSNGGSKPNSSSRPETDTESALSHMQESELSPVIQLDTPPAQPSKMPPPPPGFSASANHGLNPQKDPLISSGFVVPSQQPFRLSTVSGPPNETLGTGNRFPFTNSGSYNTVGNLVDNPGFDGLSSVGGYHLHSRGHIETVTGAAHFPPHYQHQEHNFRHDVPFLPPEQGHSAAPQMDSIAASLWSSPPLSTANPFANNMDAHNNRMWDAMPSQTLDENHNDSNNDLPLGTTLLDSGLLNSLWTSSGDKTLQTNNPFANM